MSVGAKRREVMGAERRHQEGRAHRAQGFTNCKCKGKGKVKMNGYLGVSGCGDANQGNGKHDGDMGMMSSVLGLMSLKATGTWSLGG